MTGMWVTILLMLVLCTVVFAKWILMRRQSQRLFDQVSQQIDKAMTLQVGQMDKTTNLDYWEKLAHMEQHQLDDAKIAELQQQLKKQKKRSSFQ